MLKQLLFSAALATVAISVSAEDKVLWQSEDPAGKLAGWGDPALTLSAEEAASIQAGDYLTMTIAGVDSENGWPQVALFQGNVGWPPFINEGVGGKQYPYVASFGVTPQFADSIHAHGIVFKGDGAYVSAVGLKEGTINVDPNAVWFGPKECGWGDPASVAKEVFADVKVGDKIIVDYDPSFEGMNVNLKFNGWGACSINYWSFDKVEFITLDKENGTITISLTPATEKFNWADGDNPAQDWNLIELLKENGFMVQGPSIINQIIYIPAPSFPETIIADTFTNGLEVEQNNEDGEIFIAVTGEITEETFDVVFDVPEGWDGFISLPVETEDVIISEYKVEPRKVQAAEWVSVEAVEEAGFAKGNKFTFKANGTRQQVEVHLYMDGMVDINNYITLTANVKEHYVDPELAAANQAAYEAVIAQINELQQTYADAIAEIEGLENTNPNFNLEEWEEIGGMLEQYKDWALQALDAANYDGEEFFFPFSADEFKYMIAFMIMEATPVPAEAPVLPETYDVTVSDTTLNVEQVVEQDTFTIKVEGKTKDKTVTVKVAVPEGFNRFIGMTDTDYINDVEPLKTRAEEEEEEYTWIPVTAFELITNCKQYDEFTFNVDDEEHFGVLYPVKDNLIWDEPILIEFNVIADNSSAVESINAVDNASYYDLQGNKIAKPVKGIYIKVLNGKASKVVVK